MPPIRVFAPGTWDLFHVGHLRFLDRAADLGSALIVGVCGDDLVAETKGQRPYVPLEWRVEIVEALSIVDTAVGYYTLDLSDILLSWRINVLAIGPEYGDYVEHRATLKTCKDHRIRVVELTRTPGISTSQIKGDLCESRH